MEEGAATGFSFVCLLVCVATNGCMGHSCVVTFCCIILLTLKQPQPENLLVRTLLFAGQDIYNHTFVSQLLHKLNQIFLKNKYNNCDTGINERTI